MPAPRDYTVTLYRDPAALAAGTVLAMTTGIERRDTALLIAARCLAGVDLALPAAWGVRVTGPRVDVILTRGAAP